VFGAPASLPEGYVNLELGEGAEEENQSGLHRNYVSA